MPQIEQLMLSTLGSSLDRYYDVFICSASYEERCKSIPDALADNVNVGKRLVCFNQDSSAPVTINAEHLIRRLGSNSERVSLDKTNSLTTADNLQRALSRAGGDDSDFSYLVDITTFTHEALLILLRLLQNRVRKGSVVLTYAIADEYSIGLPTEQKWLSKGIVDIRSVLGYPGDSRPSRKSHLIILVGYEGDRAERLLDEYQPHVISLGFGKEGTGTAMQHEQLNRSTFTRLAGKVSKYNEFEFSCVDALAVERTISVQASLFPECNVVIAPMNSKLSTVGVAGAAFRNDGIQICYASASQYNIEGYSRPGNRCILTALSPEFWRPRGTATSMVAQIGDTKSPGGNG